MSNLTVTECASDPVFRVGYAPDPWGFTSWIFATGGRFRGRFCDPDGTWRALYTGATPLCCYLEVLAEFRLDPIFVAGLAAISGSEPDANYPDLPPGVVPATWCDDRIVGEGALRGRYANVLTADSLSWLQGQPEIAREMIGLGIDEFDGSVIRDPRERQLTRRVSQLLYRQNPALDGIEYESRYGQDQTLWALFERSANGLPHQVTNGSTRTVSPEDPDFLEALRIFGLTLDPAL